MGYKYFGLYAVLLLLCGLSFIVIKWPQGKHRTFSQHVAAHKHSIVYYIALFGITLPLLVLFFLKWFVPTLQLSHWFSFFVVVSAITQFVCTFIPEVGGRKTTYHRALAGISAICLLPALALLPTADTVTFTGKTIALLGLSCMAAITAVVAKGRGEHTHLLLLQSAYLAAFFIPIIYVSYLQ